MKELAAHPTPKPVALIADALLDCSKRGEFVLDSFAGSGTILIAAERTGRHARAMDLDPRYVDTAIRRWQKHIGGVAIHLESGLTFDQMRAQRGEGQPNASTPTESSSQAPADDAEVCNGG